MISVLNTISATKEYVRLARAQNKSIGFVPTMGALHAGHMALIRQAKQECDIAICSIFVNPTQFNDPKDLEKYPRDFDADLVLLKQAGTDAVFLPDPQMIYPDGYRFKLTESEFSKRLCGAHRPGHFDGVLTVVMKLFQIIQADRAYFGEKDHQQLSLIRDMASAFFVSTQIISVKTVREADGLAMSSRNILLKPDDRKKAPMLYQIMKNTKSDQEAVLELEQNGFRVDYVETLNRRRYAAAFLGEVRLIDNVEI